MELAILNLPTVEVIFLQGWRESGARKKALLKEVLENISGVRVTVVDYLDAPAEWTYFRSHLTVEEYAARAEKVLQEIKKENPKAIIVVIGHSLGGIIARYLCQKWIFPPQNMILVGTPNKGISYKSFGGHLGIIITPIYWVLASRYVCNVPVFYQLLKGSSFLEELNELIPRSCHYISGSKDTRVDKSSSDPHRIGQTVQCDHHLFKFDGKSIASLSKHELSELYETAVPVVVSIVKQISFNETSELK